MSIMSAADSLGLKYYDNFIFGKHLNGIQQKKRAWPFGRLEILLVFRMAGSGGCTPME